MTMIMNVKLFAMILVRIIIVQKCRIHIHYLSVQLLMKSSLYFNDERSVKRCD